ncbi:hypothetical protein FE633_17310 [Streptomyces montanus]|uniref:Uncharacterized protein n=1 Tax=Streptomyces montanus TaxID=2580423 RepID=A0A5R9FS42_9ACTN|nr:hypothetical protein [Streptomyces montanus]TLS44906.1 hypothetical protein FE633_17310 [Streptomyces montanus]
MTSPTPLTGQQLDELETFAKNIPAGPWTVDDSRAELRGSHGNLLADLWDDRLGVYFVAMHAATQPLVAEVRRLRAELERRTEDLAAADNPTPLRWGLNDVLWGDDDTTTVLLSGPNGEPYWLELDPERAARLREDLAGPEGEEARREPEPSNRPCGHDDVPAAGDQGREER